MKTTGDCWSEAKALSKRSAPKGRLSMVDGRWPITDWGLVPRAGDPLAHTDRQDACPCLRVDGRLRHSEFVIQNSAFIISLFLLLALPLLAAEPAPPVDPQPEIREREIFVPYEEFLKVVAKDPQATVMTLAEYRTLVLLATANRQKKEPELPPVRGVLTEVVYDGQAGETSARFEARYKVSVSGEQWMACELGVLPPSLGQVTLDDQPAWIVNDGGRSYLLVKGAGAHEGAFSFTLPLKREEDTVRLQTPLPRAAASTLRLTVPGQSEAEANAPLDGRFDAEANVTRFQAGLGRNDALTMSWKARHDIEKNPPLLLAAQQIAYHLLPARPEFRWTAHIHIARRKTDRVTFRIPENLRLMRLSGNGVHAWHVEGGQVRVVLDQPVLGDLALAVEGIVALAGGTLPLSAPALQDAAQDTRHVSLWEPNETRLTVGGLQDARELAPGDAKVTGYDGTPLSRVFLVTGANPRVTLSLADWPATFDTRSAFDLVIDEKESLLTSVCQVNVERGRVYTLRLRVPAPWQLLDLKESGTDRGLSAEKTVEQDGEVWLLKLDRAAEDEQPLNFMALLRVKQESDAAVVAEWEKRDLDLATPQLEGARRATARMALRVAPAIDVAFGAMPEWRTEDPERLAAAGMNRELLRAGLATEAPGAAVKLALARRVPRGTYEAVTHLLALEQKVWVRCDLRLSVVDRALEELVVNVPEGAPEAVHILGPGVKEVAPGATATQRRVRFSQPWLGVRIFRVEYRADIEAGKDLAVPEISLQGDFDARRRIVFQSAGAVSLTPPKPDAGLALAPLDETPEFAQPFREGRALCAFVFRSGQAPGTYRTTIFERSKVLGSAVGVMDLVTVLDGSGVSRTHAAFEYHYSRDQYLKVVLPADATLLAVSVQDRTVQPVQGGTPGVHAIPLPPLTVARVELAYERKLPAWRAFGLWRETGPDLLDIPVGETRWRLYHAPGWDCSVGTCNLQPSEPREPAYFANTFWALLPGQLNLTAWMEPRWRSSVGPHEIQRFVAQPQVDVQTNKQQAIQSIEDQQRQQAEALRAFGALAMPEGILVEAGKLGGAPEYVLNFEGHVYARFAKRLSFCLAALIALVLAVRKQRRAAFAYIFGGLLLGTLLPPALDWSSPLLVVPFCEGLAVSALFALAWGAAHLVKSVFRRRMAKQAALASALLFSGLAGGEAWAEEAPALIPYPLDGVGAPDADPMKMKVYVPRERFMELMTWAYPDQKEEPVLPQLPARVQVQKSGNAAEPPQDRGVRLSVGHAHYEMTTTEKMWEARGVIEFRTFDPEDWAKLWLRFDPLQLTSVKLDDQPATVAYEGGQPFLPVKGAGPHRVAVTLRGPLERSPGRARLKTQLSGGSATRLVLRLPLNVELDQKDQAIWVTKEADAQRCELDLGAGGPVNVSWRAPDIRAPQTVQIASRSLSLLDLESDGYRVRRGERVTVDGPGVEVLSYRIVGDWDVVKVTASDLAEWAVSGEGAERRVRLWFRKAVNGVQANFEGWAPMGAEAREVAGLILENAVRQDGFISLEHGGGRRFAADSLGELKRTSWAQAERELGFAAEAKGDRLYQFHEPKTGLRVGAEWEQGKTALETRAVAILHPEQMTLCVQTRYASGDPMPWRHEVDLPAGWEIVGVRGSLMRDWEIVGTGEQRRLIVHFSQRASQGAEVVWTAEQRLRWPAAGALSLGLPLPRVHGVAQETFDWVLASDPALSVREAAGSDLRPLPLARAATWVKLDGADEYRMAFRAAKAEGKLNLDVARMDSLARADVVSFVQPAEDHVLVNAHVRFMLEQAGMDTFTFRLPTGARLTDLAAANLKERRVQEGAAGVTLTVLLQSPARGMQTIDIAYRLPRTPEKDVKVAGPTVESGAVKRQAHYVGLVRIAQGPFVVADPSGLGRKVDPEELPAVPANVSKESLTEAYIAEAGWSFVVRQPDVQVRTLPDAEVTLAELLTVLAADGEVRSVATYTVRNRARQFLRVALPLDATLWGVLVDGKPATVSQDDSGGRRVLGVPIQRLAEADLPLKVSIFYTTERLSLSALVRTFTPRAPEVLDTPVVKTLWQVYVPHRYSGTVTGGNMTEVVESLVHGARVKANVEEVNRLLQMNKSPESASQRKKVLGSLQRQQQELSDNFVQLDNNLNFVNVDEQRRLGEKVFQGQQEQSRQFRSDAKNVQDQLKDLQAQMDKASADLEAQEQRQMLDAYHFMGNGWRAGERYKEKAVEGKAQVGDVPLERLQNPRAFAGFSGAKLPAPALTPLDAQPQRLRPEPAWRTDADRQVLTTHAGAELRVPTRGILYTFQKVEGHPELALMVRSTDSTWGWSARGALLLLVALGLVFRKRLAK